MSAAKRYLKMVQWSDEDGCYVGYVPSLILGGCCHGDDEQDVYRQLCEIAEEVAALPDPWGRSLPPPTAGRDMDDVIRVAASESEQTGLGLDPASSSHPHAPPMDTVSGDMGDDAKEYQEEQVREAVAEGGPLVKRSDI